MMDVKRNASSEAATPTTPPPALSPPALTAEEEARINFYRTYDVMTGVRIAATLGGFFVLMVILVVYKSKSKTERALEDPNIVAAVNAEAEEEERQITAALEATAYRALSARKSRRSLDISSGVSPAWIKSTTRFSSVGGYSSLLKPPTSTLSKLPCSIDEDSPPEERSLYDDLSTFYNRYLNVPRRESNITCSSSGSSYLERRGSSVILGLPTAPTHKNRGRRRQSLLCEQYDYCYPINIRVIQPTPGGSPCGSERALYDDKEEREASIKNITHQRLAPLASISSCNSSLGAGDYPDLMDGHSFASDSVFRDDEYDDTDDEIDPFSTDTEEPSDTERGACQSETVVVTTSMNLSSDVSDQSLFAGANLDKHKITPVIPLADTSVYPTSSVLNIERKGRSQETLF